MNPEHTDNVGHNASATLNPNTRPTQRYCFQWFSIAIITVGTEIGRNTKGSV